MEKTNQETINKVKNKIYKIKDLSKEKKGIKKLNDQQR